MLSLLLLDVKYVLHSMRRITTDIIPVLGTVRPNCRQIGIVHRKDRLSGVSYIRVKADEDEETTPIIRLKNC